MRFKKKKKQKPVQFKLILMPKVKLVVLARNLSWC